MIPTSGGSAHCGHLFVFPALHWWPPATAQENKTEPGSGTAVAKCLLLTALSFLPSPPALISRRPLQKRHFRIVIALDVAPPNNSETLNFKALERKIR